MKIWLFLFILLLVSAYTVIAQPIIIPIPYHYECQYQIDNELKIKFMCGIGIFNIILFVIFLFTLIIGIVDKHLGLIILGTFFGIVTFLYGLIGIICCFIPHACIY